MPHDPYKTGSSLDPEGSQIALRAEFRWCTGPVGDALVGDLDVDDVFS
ncbi:MAG: hypothetical protein OEM81_13285 [Acidimicrobiia bacterium]|nr:hypothetical protein [Acidimicrobiia bacterium]